MNTVEISGLKFGEGRPKICVPLTGGSMPALISEAQKVRALPADLFEWRADCFFGNYLEAIAALKTELDRPLLCTVRTAREGGSADISPQEYENLLCTLLQNGGFEMIDIELSYGDERVEKLVKLAKQKGIGVVVSLHNFTATPPESEMLAALIKMKNLGADLPKLAVMPTTERDVLALLSATLCARAQVGPVVTMSMGGLGKVTRICGEIFGSCMTFAAGQAASAPGQINAEDLNAILTDIYPNK